MERDGVVFEDHVLNGRYIFLGFSLEYLADMYEMRTEYLTELKEDNFFDSFHTAYYEFAYHLTDQWQLALRCEFVNFETTDSVAQTTPNTLYEHTDFTLGLNYWISQNFVIKLAHHYVIGNHFAYPEDAQAYAENFITNDFTEATNLIVFGTQFSF